MLLAIDTATTTASVAIYDRNQQQLLAETTWTARRRHTQDLMNEVQQLLSLAGASMGDVDALAVTTGPGSFTGVRIGISAVKGLGLGLSDTPSVIGVPTLSVTAAPWIQIAVNSVPRATVCAYIQAGRGRYNWAWFGADDQLKRPGADDHGAGTAAEFTQALVEQASGPVWLAGELDEALYDAAAGLDHVTMVDAVSAMRRAGHLARLADQLLSEGVADTLSSVQPLYLRNP